jgi:hypothetical protein
MCLKPNVKSMNGFVPFITSDNVVGITLAPFGIYVKKDYLPPYWGYERLTTHEKIHWKQQWKC